MSISIPEIAYLIVLVWFGLVWWYLSYGLTAYFNGVVCSSWAVPFRGLWLDFYDLLPFVPRDPELPRTGLGWFVFNHVVSPFLLPGLYLLHLFLQKTL